MYKCCAPSVMLEKMVFLVVELNVDTVVKNRVNGP